MLLLQSVCDYQSLVSRSGGLRGEVDGRARSGGESELPRSGVGAVLSGKHFSSSPGIDHSTTFVFLVYIFLKVPNVALGRMVAQAVDSLPKSNPQHVSRRRWRLMGLGTALSHRHKACEAHY